MNFFNKFTEVEEVFVHSSKQECVISKESFDRFEKMMGDDKILEWIDNTKESGLSSEDKFQILFDDDNENKKEIREGLTKEQKEILHNLTDWSNEIIEFIGSWEEAEIYMKANLKETEMNGKKCLLREDIDINQEDEDGITNKERMERGRPPITGNGEEVELHHVGQKSDSPLAELTMQEHRGVGNDTILHDKTKETEIDRNEFGKERREHWKNRVNLTES